MRLLLYKSKLLILIYISAGFLLTLASAAINHQYMNSQKVLPCLSEKYVIGKVNSVNIDQNNKLTNRLVTTKIESMSQDYIFFRNISNTRGRAIRYSKDTEFRLPIIWGRLFQEEDFVSHTNTIVISQELEDRCVKIEDKNYYIFHNEYYEVIGIYQGLLGDDMKEIQFYLNLSAEQLQDDYAYGEYLLDIRDGNTHLYDEFQTYLQSIDKDAIIRQERGISTKGTGLFNVVSNAGYMIFIFLVCALLVLMNSIAASEQWITARRKEIAIRKLLGATNRSITIWIILQYGLLICISYIIAIILGSILIINSRRIKAIPTFYLLLGNKLQLQIPIISFVMLLTIGFLVLSIILYQYNKNTIVSNVR